MPHPATLPQPPGRHPAWVWRDGRQFFSLPELARRRGVSRQAVYKWARIRPHLCIRIGCHTYVREEET